MARSRDKVRNNLAKNDRPSTSGRKKAQPTIKKRQYSSSPSPSPSPSPTRSNGSKKYRRSPKPGVKYFKSPVQSKTDKNNYRLIQLPNGILALLISDKECDPVPSWQNRHCSTLGLTGYAPGPGSPFCPTSNGLQNLESATGPMKQDDFFFNSLIGKDFTPGTKLPQLHGFNEGFCDIDITSGTDTLGCSEHEAKSIQNTTASAVNTTSRNDEASFALTVHVGSSNDPGSHYGLAHFCEHMVHYGSKKYPQENNFFQFALNKGKGANAFTQGMTTTYHFSVTEGNFPKGLDIVANMLASPIFRVDCINREVQAVDNEFMLKEHKDSIRHYHLLLATIQEDHPLNNFPCGNLETLRHPNNMEGSKTLETVLRNFHTQHYVGSGMTMAVQSSLSLDDLEDHVVGKFSIIPKGNKTTRRFRTVDDKLKSPYDTQEFRKMYTVKANESKIRLILTWPMPPDAWQDWRNKSIQFLEILMNEEWEGGLSDSLRKKGWIIKWEAGCDPCEFCKNDYATLFKVEAILTRMGLMKVPEIVEMTYSYIKRLTKIPLTNKCDLWNELTKTANQNFDYSSPGHTTTLTVFAARMLQIVPGEQLFESDACIDYEFNDIVFKKYLNMLKPSRMNYMLFVPQLYDLKANFNETEPYTNAQYYIQDFSPDFINKLDNIKPFEALLSFPQNPFVNQMDTVFDEGYVKKETLFEDCSIRVDHHGHSSFSSIFKSKVQIALVSSITRSNVKNRLLLSLWGGCLCNKLMSSGSAMKRAGIEVNLQAMNVLKFEVVGFSETLLKALSVILKESLNSEEPLSPLTFDNVKFSTMDMYNDYLSDTLFLASSFHREIITVDLPSINEQINVLQKITYSDLVNFVEYYKSSSYGLVVLNGNIGTKDGLQVAEIMQDLDYSPDIGNWKLAFKTPYTIITLPAGQRCLRIKSATRNGINNVISNYYQVTKYDNNVNVKDAFTFVSQYMDAPSFHILRTQKQLGYIVSCDSYVNNGFPVLKVTVVYQSTRFTACHVDQEIDTFLLDFYREYLKDLTEEEFSDQKRLWDLSKELKLKNVIKWYEDTFVKMLTINGKDLVWNEIGGKIGKLSIQIIGNEGESCDHIARCSTSQWEDQYSKEKRLFLAKDKDDNGNEFEDPYFIHDIKSFRNSRVR